MADTGTLATLDALVKRLEEELKQNPVFVEYQTTKAAAAAIRKSRATLDTNGVHATHVVKGEQTVKITRPGPKENGKRANLIYFIPLILKEQGKPLTSDEIVMHLEEKGQPISKALKDDNLRDLTLETWANSIGRKHGVSIEPREEGEPGITLSLSSSAANGAQPSTR